MSVELPAAWESSQAIVQNSALPSGLAGCSCWLVHGQAGKGSIWVKWLRVQAWGSHGSWGMWPVSSARLQDSKIVSLSRMRGLFSGQEKGQHP